jgi:hypothetical protein
MTEYTKHLHIAWNYLIKQYERENFRPLKEADVQAFLYHSLIKSGLEPSKIHVEWSGGKNKRCDMVLGNKKLFVEIKWSSL